MAEIDLEAAGVKFRAVFDAPTEQQAQEELGIIPRARKAGLDNQPPSDANDLSADEEAIVFWFKNWLLEIEKRVYVALDKLKYYIETEAPSSHRPNLPRYVAEMGRDAAQIRNAHRESVIQSRRSERDAMRKLKFFKEKHGIDRDAKYPPSKLYNISIIVGIILLEGVANAYFFGKGSDLGLLGGWFSATLTSTTNILISFFVIGYLCLRTLHINDNNRRVLAVTGIFVSVVALLVLNLTAAHYRDLVESSVEGGVIAAFSHMLSSPLGLRTFEAILLLLLSFMFSAVAIYEGYTLDDVYPGYGDVTRIHAAAHQSYIEARKALHEKTTEAAHRWFQQIDTDVSSYKARVIEYQRALNLFTYICQHYKEFSQNFQRACHNGLRRYREENKSVRTAVPPPYFLTYPKITLDTDLPKPPNCIDTATLNRFIDTLELEGSKIKAEFQNDIENEYERIDSFINEMEGKARQRTQADELV